jgi:hypothetical protein
MRPPKKPAERRFQGLVGMPPELPDDGDAPPLRRGRPPKGERAMTQAERKRQSRLHQQGKVEDAEKRNLVAKLMKIEKRRLPFANAESGWNVQHEVMAERRLRLQTMHDEWILLPIEELRKLLALNEEQKDSTGRLHGEPSGEAPRKNGQSGVEQVVAAEESKTVVDDAAGGSRGGDATNNYNVEKETSTRPPRGMRIPKEHIDYLDKREEIITQLIKKFTQPEGSGLRCLLCEKIEDISSNGVKKRRISYPVFIADPSDARQHFWEEYEKGRQMYFRYQDLKDIPALADGARRAYLRHRHLQEVWLRT